MIKVISNRRRMLNRKVSYNSPHNRSNKALMRVSHEERAQRNRDRKRAKLDHIKVKNKPRKKKSKKPKKSDIHSRYTYEELLNFSNNPDHSRYAEFIIKK